MKVKPVQRNTFEHTSVGGGQPSKEKLPAEDFISEFCSKRSMGAHMVERVAR